MSSNSRSPERVRHHYEVERELAARMRGATRETRTELFKTLYTELFERVPDHPRLTRRETMQESEANTEKQLRLLEPHFRDREATLLEIAPGDCRLGYAASALCENVIGVDISDQRAADEQSPVNFQLIVYDGYELDLPDESVDIAFSYQFLEHLHPDDVEPHFDLIYRLLKSGGVYVFDTPHRYSGPHDISRFFGDSLDCFHFQEWTYREMRVLAEKHGFSDTWFHRRGEIRYSLLLNTINDFAESLIGVLPGSIRKKIAARLFPAVTLTIKKV